MRARLLAVLPWIAACASHRHEPAAHPDDPHRLYVELSVAHSHKRPLRDGAKAGLAKIPFVVPLGSNRGGDTELQLKVARLDAVGRETVCSIQVLVLRLPAHELMGMAEGNARAGGTDGQARDDCIEHLGASLVGGRVRTVLQKRLGEKR
jgi:hypothetical protein